MDTSRPIMIQNRKATAWKFVDQVLLPEFRELNAELARYLDEVTTRLIREEVHRDTSEAPDGSQHIT